MCIQLCTTVVHNTARSSSDNIFPNIHTGCRVVSVLDSGAEGLSLCFIVLFFTYSVCLSVCLCVFVYGQCCLIQIKGRRAWVQIAAATLSGNSPRQTVHTHRASVHQAAKLVAALSMVMAANRRVYDSRHLQADCQEPRSAPEHYARQSSVGCLF